MMDAIDGKVLLVEETKDGCRWLMHQGEVLAGRCSLLEYSSKHT